MHMDIFHLNYLSRTLLQTRYAPAHPDDITQQDNRCCYTTKIKILSSQLNKKLEVTMWPQNSLRSMTSMRHA